MKGYLKYFLVIVVKALFMQVLFSQEPVYKKFTLSDGLPSMQVYDIYQDVNGYLWFATDAGISKYIGKEFNNYKIEDGLSSNTVFKFFPQKNGDIWCTTFNSTLFYFNPKDYIFKKPPFELNIPENFINYPPEELLVLGDSVIYLSYSSKTGKIMVTKDTTIVSFDNYSDKHIYLVIEKIENNYFYYASRELQKLTSLEKKMYISSLHVMAANSLYYHAHQHGKYSMFSTIDGVYIKVGDSLVCKIEKNKKPLNFGMLDDENFWVAYESGGFAIYDFEGKLQKRYLQKVSGTFMCRDNFNGLWFSTLSRGVFYTANLDLINISALEGKSVYKLGLSENEDLYVSLYNKSLVKIKKGGGLNIHTKSGTSLLMPFSYYDVEANLELFDNSAFYMKDKRFVLRGGLSFNANTGKWFLQEEVFPHQKGKYLNSIAKSSNAYIVGTQSGAYRLSVNGELLKIKEGKLKGRINDVKVINIFELYSTHGSGIQIYKDQKYFQEITTSTGLPSNLINQLVVKNDSSIYVCSKKGLSEIILKEGRWTFLSNHLLNYDVSDAEFVGDSVWIGTNDGLLKMPVSDKGNQLEKVNLFLQLKEIRVNGQLTSIDELLHLETDQNNLKLNYDAIYYSDHNKLQFRYKLSTEENWSYTKNRSLLYNYIEPGDYTLSIQVSIDDTHWDEEVLLNFSIRLPYYATLIFLVIMLFIIAVFIYLIFKFRIILYNKVLVNSLAKLLVRKLSQSEKYIVIREQGKDIKIFSHQILFVRSSGNYCEIHIDDKKYLTRAKISNFYDQLPDQNNYLKIHRSYFVRIDKIIGKTKNSIMIKDVELKVSNSFLLNLRKVKL